MRTASPGLQCRAMMWMARLCHEVVPCRHDAAAGIGEDEIGLGPEIDLGEGLVEEILICPVRRRGAVLEQPRLGEHDRAGAGRIDRGTLPVAPLDPVYQLGIAPGHVLLGPNQSSGKITISALGSSS